MAATLDTLQIVKRLREAGFDEPQAEAVTGVFRDLRDADFAQLATKADIERLEMKLASRFEQMEMRFEQVEMRFVGLEAKLGSEIGRLEAKIEANAAAVKTDIIRWVLGVAFAQAAFIVAIIRLFGGHP